MQQYNMLQAIYMSFYSKNLYRDVAKNWDGKTFLYLFLLLALSWIGFTYHMQVTLNLAYQGISQQIVDQIPLIEIKDGKVVTPEQRPYIIRDPDTHEKLAIIDTTGQYKTLEEAKTDFLVTQTSVISHQKSNETRIYTIPEKTNLEINPVTINQKIQHYLGYAWIVVFICALFASYIYRIFQALLYSLIGLIFNGMNKTQLTYGQILQIMMVAITPVIVLSTIWDFLRVSFAYQSLSYFVLAMLYLFYGIAANKD